VTRLCFCGKELTPRVGMFSWGACDGSTTHVAGMLLTPHSPAPVCLCGTLLKRGDDRWIAQSGEATHVLEGARGNHFPYRREMAEALFALLEGMEALGSSPPGAE